MVEILLGCCYNKNDIKKGDMVMRAHTVILGASNRTTRIHSFIKKSHWWQKKYNSNQKPAVRKSIASSKE